MTAFTLRQIDDAVRASWSLETTNIDAAARARWDPTRPVVGQCGATALVVQDLLGGELLIARVSGGSDGEQDENHYWNRLGGLDIDLTREQFAPDRVVGEPTVVIRPVEGPRKHVAAYELMRTRVFTALGLPVPGAAGEPSRGAQRGLGTRATGSG